MSLKMLMEAAAAAARKEAEKNLTKEEKKLQSLEESLKKINRTVCKKS